MKERPILFSTEMVQAILDGRKTMTRRILKVRGCRPFIPDESFTKETIERWNKNYHPYGQISDILWVRESFGFYSNTLFYKADDSLAAEKWKPSIHMPKSSARIWLQITDIRVERLQDITEDDAISEGIKVIEKDEAYFDYQYNVGSCATAKGSFYSLWTSINGQASFDANPWVWVISFKVLSTIGKPSNL